MGGAGLPKEVVGVPQRDIYHDVVRNALVKDGWTITHDPYTLRFGGRKVYLDLGADLPIGAEKAGRKIAVEVKSFTGYSEVTDLERALGQFQLYGFCLSQEEPDRVLFLAVPADTYSSLFREPDAVELARRADLRLLVYDPEKEVLERWIE